MGHEELKEIGINAYGHRHKLIKGVERLLGGQQGKLFRNNKFQKLVVQGKCQGWHLNSGGLTPELVHSLDVAPPAFSISVIGIVLPLIAPARNLSHSCLLPQRMPWISLEFTLLPFPATVS